MALTVIVESAILVRAATWSLVTRRMLCFSRISSRRSMMYGTKSSVTPAKGSSSTWMVKGGEIGGFGGGWLEHLQCAELPRATGRALRRRRRRAGALPWGHFDHARAR